MSIWYSGTNFNEIWIKKITISIDENALETVVCKILDISSWLPYVIMYWTCNGLDGILVYVLIDWLIVWPFILLMTEWCWLSHFYLPGESVDICNVGLYGLLCGWKCLIIWLQKQNPWPSAICGISSVLAGVSTQNSCSFNSLTPGICGSNFENITFKVPLWFDILSNTYEIKNNAWVTLNKDFLSQ